MNSAKTPGQQLVMLFGLSLCCMFIGQAISRIIVLLYYGEQLSSVEVYDPILILTTAGISHVFVHLVVFFLFLRITNMKWVDVFPFMSSKVLYLALLPLLAIIGILLAAGLSQLSLSFFEANGFHELVQNELNYQQALLPLLVHDNLAQLILSLFVFAVLPAIGEEFIYRGLLQTRLIEATNNLNFSVIVSALIFAAMHFQPVNLLAIAVMGMILGYVYALSRNIWYSVLLHFLINAMQVLQAYCWPDQIL
jgi:membrane protease YdiL (CAAX protease family)